MAMNARDSAVIIKEDSWVGLGWVGSVENLSEFDALWLGA